MAQRISTMAVLAMRAIAETPAGANRDVIQKHIVNAVQVRNSSAHVVIATLLRKGFATERAVRQPGMRHAPVHYYSLTPRGWAVLSERSLLPVTVPRPAPLPAMAQQISPRHAQQAMGLAALPRWRRPTPTEVRRAGLKPWQVPR